MPGANLIVVGTFGTAPEAELAKGAPEAAGIDAMIRADSVGGVEPNVAWASSGYKPQARKSRSRRASTPYYQHQHDVPANRSRNLAADKRG
jgi:hypothetical protein